ncbi:hypothetical protein GKC30_04340 [Pseudodesulfovibrio sp. F-1]|uniref:Schlafen AlbA-2 domain-containing protein n=1 Tax=Pseudodesulfovibrio alkaliphilus TaxID=2661613 RepID=A0A7K1KLB1_9BACT|nr:ATP-binding protein [Pseudodesulfovibrio alkaliphilus]MUM76859.1 hypothetical protein [Pseudodesulfovibrio alkaliphilus]
MFDQRPAQSIIRGKNLYRILQAGVLLAWAVLGALVFWGVREVRHDAAAVAVESSAKGLAGAVTVLVNAVTTSGGDMVVSRLDSLGPSDLRRTFTDILGRHPDMASIMVSDGEGLRYLLLRGADGLLEAVPGQDGGWTLWRPDGSSSAAVAPERFDGAAVDKALAEEFRHLEPGQVNWRSAGRYVDAGESWLAAASLVQGGAGRVMLSFVFPVGVVVNQLDGAEKGRAEKVFLFWDNGSVLPVGDADRNPGAARQPGPAQEIPDPVIAAAAERMARDASLRGVPVPLRVRGEVWWAYLAPLSVFGDTLSLGVVVPMAGVIPSLGSDTFLQVFGSALALLGVAALYLLRRNRSRIETLGMRHGAARNADDVLRLIAEGESRGLEFKQTMRFNLKAGKNGKEIEHAIVKSVSAFINSEGGTLLVGVADDGTVTGFAEDSFANDDKALLHFNNLVNQYLGAEFSRYVETMAIQVGGATVIRALCMPARVPAILKNGQSEEFYVRSGPASRQLSFSQFHEWLRNH